MKDVVGSPGTWSGLALRVSQCLCAAASFTTMWFADGSEHYSAFWFMAISMEMLFFWSFTRAWVDITSLRNNIDLHNLDHVCMVLVYDWLAAFMSFASTAASAGVAIYLERDFNHCKTNPHLSCGQYKLSVILASMTWSFIAASATASFWLMASLI
ncbi:hypothetical protein EJB05_44494 [Eragrostis curvula]|uniref:CASP-like protein n=1 Tax=Eragrostis curvula TaxID=38414 RepID=A0A5J9TJ77_9POAL|nr:hypothetical protein EJB05_44494 [Eragrostis curvula]